MMSSKTSSTAVTLTLVVTCLALTAFLQADADVCYRKFVEEKSACRGRMRGHRDSSNVQQCCNSKHAQGYAQQLVRVNGSKNWFECLPCRHGNVTSAVGFPDDVIRQQVRPRPSTTATTVDNVNYEKGKESINRMSSNEGRSYVYELNRPASSNDSSGWSGWSEWSECSVSCGEGSQVRVRSCKSSQKDGQNQQHSLLCHGPSNDVRNCTTPTTNCPVDGQWSGWTEWTSCSADCTNEGVETRTRTCSNPAPQHGGKPCQGLELESMPCVKRFNCPVDGGWSSWSHADICSAVPCSGRRGHRTFFRSCTNPRPMFGGTPCRGRSWKVQPCYNNEYCTDKVDGGWCEWTEWTECYSEVTIKSRTRRCECPPPANSGNNCPGDDREEMLCNSGTREPSTKPPEDGDRNTQTPRSDCSDETDVECDLEQEQLAVDHGSAAGN